MTRRRHITNFQLGQPWLVVAASGAPRSLRGSTARSSACVSIRDREQLKVPRTHGTATLDWVPPFAAAVLEFAACRIHGYRHLLEKEASRSGTQASRESASSRPTSCRNSSTGFITAFFAVGRVRGSGSIGGGRCWVPRKRRSLAGLPRVFAVRRQIKSPVRSDARFGRLHQAEIEYEHRCCS